MQWAIDAVLSNNKIIRAEYCKNTEFNCDDDGVMAAYKESTMYPLMVSPINVAPPNEYLLVSYDDPISLAGLVIQTLMNERELNDATFYGEGYMEEEEQEDDEPGATDSMGDAYTFIKKLPESKFGFVAPGQGTKSLAKEFEESKHPRDAHGRFGSGDGAEAPSTRSWPDIEQDFKNAADSLFDEMDAPPSEESMQQYAAGFWAESFDACKGIQEATDDWINGRPLNASGDYNELAVFSAKTLNDSMTGGTFGYFESDETHYRGIEDPDGNIAAKFEVGKTVEWNIAASTPQLELAQMFVDDKGVLLKTEGTVSGAVISTADDENGSEWTEHVIGGSFQVLDKTTDENGTTVVTVKQTDGPVRIQ